MSLYSSRRVVDNSLSTYRTWLAEKLTTNFGTSLQTKFGHLLVHLSSPPLTAVELTPLTDLFGCPFVTMTKDMTFREL